MWLDGDGDLGGVMRNAAECGGTGRSWTGVVELSALGYQWGLCGLCIPLGITGSPSQQDGSYRIKECEDSV